MEPNLRTSKQRIIRTLRVKNKNVTGTLANLVTALSRADADIGNISTVYLGELYNVRDITVLVNDDEHLKEVIKTVKIVPNVSLKQVIDEVLERHHGGKIKVMPTYPVKNVDDLGKVYTPGVAQVCILIKKDPKLAAHYTAIQKSVAIVTNGSRILGLGNLGPLASMPVMEGKAALFSQLTGLSMYPILINTRDVDKFVDTVVEISTGFGAIQLEDIESPANFEIEEKLCKLLNKPVMHDDQHGTAVVALAAAINACRLCKKGIKDLKVGLLGLGAAGQAIGALIGSFIEKDVLGSDINKDACERFAKKGGSVSNQDFIMKNCDLVIMTTGKKNLIKPDMIKKGQIIMALSNPFPEITISEALKGGAAFALDGTRVNNLLGYPGIFKGCLEVHASKITTAILIAAAQAIAHAAPGREPLPNVLDPDVHETVSRAVAEVAIQSGLAQHIPDQDHFTRFEMGTNNDHNNHKITKKAK